MNKVILIGNLTRDPESATTANGVSYTRFTIAVNRAFANQNGERETDYFPIIAWRGLADNCFKFLFKGSKVCVVGSLQTREYDDKDGVTRRVTEAIAGEVEFLSTKPTEPSTPQQTAQKRGKRTIEELELVENDDLPF